MAFQHGVYTSEVETSISAAPSVDASLPFVVGSSKAAFGPKVVSSWAEYVEVGGFSDDDAALEPTTEGWHPHSLTSFAYFWFRIAGRGDCVMVGIESDGLSDGSAEDADVTQTAILSALDKIDTVYEVTRRQPSLICVPYFNKTDAVKAAMHSKALKYGGQFKAIALADIPANSIAGDDQSVSPVTSADSVATAKTAVSPYLVSCWPYAGVDDMRFDLSTVLAATMNRVDGENGGLPFVSPSNKNCYVNGLYAANASLVETPIFMNRDAVNTKIDGNGVVTARNTAAGWVAWGNNTTAYPGSSDIKDYMMPIRRMFNYVQNLWQVFAAPRIDNPLNKRQLDGVVNSFNQVLASLQGFGALNAASIALDDARNTTATLLAGTVYFKIMIAPPPPLQVIHGVFEYDVVGFEASLA